MHSHEELFKSINKSDLDNVVCLEQTQSDLIVEIKFPELDSPLESQSATILRNHLHCYLGVLAQIVRHETVNYRFSVEGNLDEG